MHRLFIPTPCHELSLHDRIVWHNAGEWSLFQVTALWQDGCCVASCATHRPQACFVHRQQWVARVVWEGSETPNTPHSCETIAETRMQETQQDTPSQKPASVSPHTFETIAETTAETPNGGENVLKAIHESSHMFKTIAETWSSPTLTMPLQGISMGAMIPDGATLQIVPHVWQQTQPGQVLVVVSPQLNWVAHRVIRLQQGPSGLPDFLVMKGDFRRHPDAPVEITRILGRVHRVVWQGQSWHPQAWTHQIKSFFCNQTNLWKTRINRLWSKKHGMF